MQQTLHRNRQARRVDVDEEARALLPPAPSSALATPTKDPARVHANALAARRFFKRVDGLDLRPQHGEQPDRAHLSTWLQWITAPIDPLLPEEAATIGAASRARGSSSPRLYVKNQVRPVGMTLERAIAIAHVAQDALDNGTAPTYV